VSERWVAVALYGGEPSLHAHILHGTPLRVRPRPAGAIALFDERELVLYQVENRARQAYLFRGKGRVSIPGVWPFVNLLVHASGRAPVRRLLGSLEWLVKHRHDPGALEDVFWLRLGALLNKQQHGCRELKALLQKAT
jgi:hypothetical protein